jgi:acyl-CoA thioesterase YciA
MSFIRPVAVGDEVSIYGRIAKVGNSSIHVDVAAYRRRRLETVLFKVTAATFIMVAVGEDGKPRPLPPEEQGKG